MTTRPTITRRPDPLQRTLRAWFERNPHDSLAAPDAEQKFGVHRVTAARALRALHAAGVVDYAEGTRRRPAEYVLRLQGGQGA